MDLEDFRVRDEKQQGNGYAERQYLPIFRKLCAIAIPICLSSILQQLFNASDTAVVGNFSSSQAMAAVGTNAPVINVVVTFFSGLSIGSNVMLSSFIGSGNRDKVNEALHTSFMVAWVWPSLTCGSIFSGCPF